MKSIILVLIFSFSSIHFSIEKKSIYAALSNNSTTQIDDMIQHVEKETPSSLNRAYKGALITKKASFEKNAASKIKLFKIGKQLLELEISKFPKEVEYRFLRLTIQEHAPKILKYKHNIKEDIGIIIKGYPSLNKELKKIIFNYAKNSPKLNSSNLK